MPSAPSQERQSHDAQKSAVRGYFGKSGGDWGARYERPPARMSDLDLLLRRRNFQELLAPLLAAEPALRVLDIGCGGVSVFDGMTRERLHVVACDLVPEMVRAAAQRGAADEYFVADASRLPLANASVDLIVCSGVLEYVPEPLAALRGMQRSLRRDGRLLISFPNRVGLLRRLSKAEIAIENAALWAVNLLRGRPRTIEKPPYRHAQWSPAEAERLLAEAGLRVEQIRFGTFGLWGRVGRWRASLRLSEYLTARWGASRALGGALAATMVVQARRNA
ncbi:MAG: methyltransferase domain-containing protein [Phycisphaerae bacterium]